MRVPRREPRHPHPRHEGTRPSAIHLGKYVHKYGAAIGRPQSGHRQRAKDHVLRNVRLRHGYLPRGMEMRQLQRDRPPWRHVHILQRAPVDGDHQDDPYEQATRPREPTHEPQPTAGDNLEPRRFKLRRPILEREQGKRKGVRTPTMATASARQREYELDLVQGRLAGSERAPRLIVTYIHPTTRPHTL